MAQCYDKPIWTLGSLLEQLPRLPNDLLRLAPSLAGKGLSHSFREAIMLAVSAQNRCRYCQTAHSTFGEAAGLSQAEVRAILDDALEQGGLPLPQRLVLAYVRDMARRDFEGRDESLLRELQQHFDGAELEQIEATARLMNLANRFGNTFDALLTRVQGACDRSGAGWADMAVTAPIFLAGAAMAAPAVGLGAALAKARRYLSSRR